MIAEELLEGGRYIDDNNSASVRRVLGFGNKDQYTGFRVILYL